MALAGTSETFKSVDAGKLTSKFDEKVTGKVKLDSADKSDTVSFFRFAPFTVTAETDTIRTINFLKFETGGIHV